VCRTTQSRPRKAAEKDSTRRGDRNVQAKKNVGKGNACEVLFQTNLRPIGYSPAIGARPGFTDAVHTHDFASFVTRQLESCDTICSSLTFDPTAPFAEDRLRLHLATSVSSGDADSVALHLVNTLNSGGSAETALKRSASLGGRPSFRFFWFSDANAHNSTRALPAGNVRTNRVRDSLGLVHIQDGCLLIEFEWPTTLCRSTHRPTLIEAGEHRRFLPFHPAAELTSDTLPHGRHLT
jgi:hypothetical protein